MIGRQVRIDRLARLRWSRRGGRLRRHAGAGANSRAGRCAGSAANRPLLRHGAPTAGVAPVDCRPRPAPRECRFRSSPDDRPHVRRRHGRLRANPGVRRSLRLISATSRSIASRRRFDLRPRLRRRRCRRRRLVDMHEQIGKPALDGFEIAEPRVGGVEPFDQLGDAVFEVAERRVIGVRELYPFELFDQPGQGASPARAAPRGRLRPRR